MSSPEKLAVHLVQSTKQVDGDMS